jgi:serine/threonine protein kinase
MLGACGTIIGEGRCTRFAAPAVIAVALAVCFVSVAAAAEHNDVPPPPPPTVTGGLEIQPLPPRIKERLEDELGDEECWFNEPNLTFPTALACSLTSAHAYTLQVGGINDCCIDRRQVNLVGGNGSTVASGTSWVGSLDMATHDLWIDDPPIPFTVRGYTACGMSRDQLVLTNASADANSPTNATDSVYFLDKTTDGSTWVLQSTAKLTYPRRRAAMADTYNYTYVFGGVDADNNPVLRAERRHVSGGDFEPFADTEPVCDCAVAIHDIEIFIVCSNCSTRNNGTDQAGERNLFYTICLEKNVMTRKDGWRAPSANAGQIVSVSGASIAQYAVFLTFYANSVNPVVNYWDLYLDQLHQITTDYLTVPRTHGSAFVSQASLWYAGGLYFPEPGQLTDTLVSNTDSVPVMQKYKFEPTNSPDWIYLVGDPITIECAAGHFFRLAQTARCLTPVAGATDAIPCQGDTPITIVPLEPAAAYGCMSKGTCAVPMGQRRPCGPPGIDFRACNKAYGCCYDSNTSQCFQYEAPQNESVRLFYQCAELYPLVIQPKRGTPPPLTAGPDPTPPPAGSSAANVFLHSSMGQVVISAAAVVLVATVAAIAWLAHQRTARRRLGSRHGDNGDLDVIHGKYHVTRKLGQGGFGSVYLVTRKSDMRQFALKYIPCNNDEDRAFALKEFELVRQSQGHPNMITIHDMFMNWEDDDDMDGKGGNPAINGTPRQNEHKREQEAQRKAALASPLLNPNRRFVCIVMTYLPGGDLAHYIVHAMRTGNRIPQDWILQVLARQMVSVLDHLHNRPTPIVHRDLKPENVLLTTDRGQVILTDFGLAQEQINTYMSTRAGSLHYVAPECWKKHYSSAVDMWAVGCILYATATGRATAHTARVMFHDAKERGFAKEIREELTVGSQNRYTDDFATFVLALLQVDHRRRLSAPAALSWLDDIKAGVPRRTGSSANMNSSGHISHGRARGKSTRSSTASAASPLVPPGERHENNRSPGTPGGADDRTGTPTGAASTTDESCVRHTPSIDDLPRTPCEQQQPPAPQDEEEGRRRSQSPPHGGTHSDELPPRAAMDV